MILTFLLLTATLVIFGLGFYLGNQVGSTAHIRSKLNTSHSEQLTTGIQG
ncbi:hypothetical protein MNBD_GAMMA22-1741 [hydrothermal vent metagenome]|uniref:Uncharacterized protein n=1 Tax=hydrothermal vent metagenome TaxID=652676 RepID=A0A3B1ADV0_9ZZZZ